MRKRRGIGTVIATAIMVFLIVLTVSQLYTYNIDQLDNYNQVAAQVFNTVGQKLNEHITISNVALDTSGTLSTDILATITVTNSGGVTSQVVAIWFDNVDVSTALHNRIAENVFIGQGLSSTFSNLDTGVPFTSLVRLTVKVVTALGNTASVQLLPPGLAGTTASTLATTALTLVPPNPITSNNMIVTLTVTNNNKQGVALTNLSPDICVVEGSIAPLASKTLSSGTATSATSTTISDSGKSWGTNQLVGDTVAITSGTGAGQSRTISSNTGSSITVSTAWGTTPDTTSKYAVQLNCHLKNTPLATGTVSSATSSTLTDSGQSWSTNQWLGFVVAIVAGTGAGQSATILSNTATSLTIAGAWGTTPTSTSQYVIQGTSCKYLASQQSTSAPVSCSPVPGPSPTASPSGASFVPYGGTVIFQWTYLVNTVIADSPITVVASYSNLTTSVGLFPSQIASQTATVRGAGGASGSAGGNFQNAFGSLVNLFLSFQFSQDGTNWKASSNLAANRNTMFRVNMTNLSSKTIAFNSTSEVFLLDLKTTQLTDFFIIKSCVTLQPFFKPTTGGPACTVQTYPGDADPTARYFVGPSQTITLYFGASAKGGNSAQKLPSSGDSFLAIVSLFGTTLQGQSTTLASGAASFGAGLSPSESNTAYLVLVQTGWTTTTTVTNKQTTGFTISFGTGAPASCATQNCPTLSWAVYNNNGVAPGQPGSDHGPYAQAAPFWVIGT